MNQYLVDFELPELFNDEFLALIPEQRKHVDQLMRNGTLLSYALSNDRSKVWAMLNADSEVEVNEILEEMPLISFMTPTIYELAFLNIADGGLPAISMN